jgi:hypothetical protein
MVMGVKQHFVGLRPIGADIERTAVTQLKVGDLQLHPFAGNDCPIFAPVKLEGLSGGKLQGDVGVPAGRLLLLQLLAAPMAGKHGNPVIGAVKAQGTQIGVHLFGCAPLFLWRARLVNQPLRELVGKGIQLARGMPLRVNGFYCPAAEVMPDGVPG